MKNPTVRQQIRDLLATGHTPREIARRLDLSTQRVYQIMEDMKRAAAKREGAA